MSDIDFKNKKPIESEITELKNRIEKELLKLYKVNEVNEKLYVT